MALRDQLTNVIVTAGLGTGVGLTSLVLDSWLTRRAAERHWTRVYDNPELGRELAFALSVNNRPAATTIQRSLCEKYGVNHA